jgi:pSer/pThr/pTyr-binding forkhead associated (FHA) protein
MPYKAREGALASYLDRHNVCVELAGPCEGIEREIDRERITLGRGPGVDLAVQADGLAREHASIEFWGEAFVIRDVDTRYPVHLNGGEVHCAELKDGDHIAIGSLELYFRCSQRL